MEIQNKNYFAKVDLLTKSDLETICNEENGPNAKAYVVVKTLKKYMFSNEGLYILEPVNVLYRKDKKTNSIDLLISKLLEQSYENLQPEEMKVIKLQDKKLSLFQNASIAKYSEHVYTYLYENINTDIYTDQIHFKNGYIDLRTGEFSKRVVGQHYITQYNPDELDFSIIDEEATKYVKKCVRSTYVNEDDYNAVFYKIGRALTGRADEDQSIFTLFGAGSSGKTTTFTLIKSTMPIYIKNLKEDALSWNCSNIDKVVNTFIAQPQIRYAVINDPKDTKLNDSALKNWADGEIDTVKLYAEGSHTVKLQCLLVMVMNTLLQTKIDSGIARRIKNGMYEHKSKFTEDEKEVNEKKLIFLKNAKLKEIFQNNKAYRMAFVKLLVDHAKLTYTKPFKPSQNFIDSYEAIISANNFVGDFINLNLIQTGNDDDRITKDAMHKRFKEKYPDKILNAIQLMSSLKDQKLRYESKYRCDGMQGCFVGLKWKNDDDVEDGVKNEQSIKPTLDQEIEHYTNLLQSLKQKKIGELEAKFMEHLESKNKTEISKKGMDKFLVSKEDTETEIEPYGDVEPESEDERPKKKIKKDKQENRDLLHDLTVKYTFTFRAKNSNFKIGDEYITSVKQIFDKKFETNCYCYLDKERRCITIEVNNLQMKREAILETLENAKWEVIQQDIFAQIPFEDLIRDMVTHKLKEREIKQKSDCDIDNNFADLVGSFE